MDYEQRQRLNTWNKRIARAADRQPTPGLQKSFKAIGLRYDLKLATDEHVIIHGFSMATIAKECRGTRFARSLRQLKDDLDLFVECGVATKERGERYGSNQPTNTITLSLTKTVPVEAIEAIRKERRLERERREWLESIEPEFGEVSNVAEFQPERTGPAPGRTGNGNAFECPLCEDLLPRCRWDRERLREVHWGRRTIPGFAPSISDATCEDEAECGQDDPWDSAPSSSDTSWANVPG
jgi:hypothetical protein